MVPIIVTSCSHLFAAIGANRDDLFRCSQSMVESTASSPTPPSSSPTSSPSPTPPSPSSSPPPSPPSSAPPPYPPPSPLMLSLCLIHCFLFIV